MTKKLTVIAPTYNESENVQRFVDSVSGELRGIDYEILIVDDDSPDHTWQRVEEIARRDSRVRILRRLADPGLSASVVDGFGNAAGDVVACMDADLQHDPTILPQMLKEIEEGADLVVGSRYVEGGGVGNWNWFRKFESWVATKLAEGLLGVKVHDPMSGYFMIRREDFLRIRDRLCTEGFKILLEIVVHLSPNRIREVPFTFRPRMAGESKLSSKIIFQYLRQLWRLSRISSVIPWRFLQFGLVGATGVFVNLVTMALILYLTEWRDWRVSALATFAAIINNYVLNNLWTFRDRARAGWAFVTGYFVFLPTCLVGFAVTVGLYTLLTRVEAVLWSQTRPAEALPVWALMAAQLVAIVFGSVSNYWLSKSVTWRPVLRTKEASSYSTTGTPPTGPEM